MIVGIGIVKPHEDNNEEKEVKNCCKSQAEPRCEAKSEAQTEPREDGKSKADEMCNALNMVAELLAEVAPDDHKPVLLAPTKATKIVDLTHDMLHLIMETPGMDDTCKVAAIAVEAMNATILTLDAAIDKMRKCVKEENADA